MKTLKNPGPQWDKAAEKLAALCAEGDVAALKVAAACPASCETACHYFDGEISPEGSLVESLKSLVWWDETIVDDGQPVKPWEPVSADVEVPGGWKSDD